MDYFTEKSIFLIKTVLTRAVGGETRSPRRIGFILIQFICRCNQHYKEKKSGPQRHCSQNYRCSVETKNGIFRWFRFSEQMWWIWFRVWSKRTVDESSEYWWNVVLQVSSRDVVRSPPGDQPTNFFWRAWQERRSHLYRDIITIRAASHIITVWPAAFNWPFSSS